MSECECVDCAPASMPRVVKLKISLSLAEELLLSRGSRIEWGEPDDEGCYTPTVYAGSES